MSEAEAEAETAVSIEQQLDALEARGGRGYDAPACDCVRALLTRAEELGGNIAVRLRDRAAAHLSSLEQRFERDQRRISDAIERSEQQHGPQPELRKRLARGELALIGRKVRRLRALPVSLRRRPAFPADVVGARPPGAAPARAPDALRERRRRVVAYEDSVAQLVASFALARATDVVPSDAGPYNPLRIASELLDRMRAVSPLYLAVQLNRLEELGSLLGLPELPNRAPEKPRTLQKPAAKSAARKPNKRGS